MRDNSKKVTFFGASLLKRRISREAYASDASIYQIDPQRIICPANQQDAIAAVSKALRRKISVTPRGAGSGLSGGALGSGCLVDCSRLTQVIEVSTSDNTVVCEPGIIYRDLNLYLKDFGLFFPPDPSSGDSCEIGGMLANNSSGPRSVKYGLTSDYIEELTLVGADGKAHTVKKYALDSPELETFLGERPEYRDILDVLKTNRGVINRGWPRTRKNSAGYNLKQVVADLDKGIFNIPALYMGSEGTLGLFLSAKLRVLPLTGKVLSYRLFFDSLEHAGEAVAPLLETGPSALEIVDGSTLDLIGREKYGVLPDAQAMLLLEYDDDLIRREDSLNRIVGRLKLLRPPEQAVNAKARESLWGARKAIVPTLYRHHAIKRPIAFIEDASLPVEKLTSFISWVRQRLEKENLTFGLFGHIGDGNLHIRPLLDINAQADFELMQTLYAEVYEKIFSYGGSSTAEHADGRLRAPVLRRLYGDDIYDIFLRVKEILDPQKLFNPDVILSDLPFTENIDFKKVELTCAACGKCNGYCPAFEIFRREDMSARGWLRMLKSGKGSRRELEQFFKFCLNCKNCTIVCPAGVDIAGEILSFKAVRPGRIAGRVISLFDKPKVFGRMLRFGASTYPMTRSYLGRKLTALAGKISFGFDDQAVFPSPAKRTLRERYPELCAAETGVALFHGCADNYFDSTTGDSLVRVFRHYDIPLAFPEQTCCGLPMEVYGHRDNLIAKARYNIDSLSRFDAVVFTCASCLHRIADYPELFVNDFEYHDKALALKAKLFDVSQFLLKQKIDLPGYFSSGGVKVTYHHPCHLRAAKLENEPLDLLGQIAGLEIMHPELAGRCCGQAGSYGFVHYQEGAAIFSEKKAEYQKLGAKIITSSCPSCISKIRKEMGDGIRVCHPVEIIADLIEGQPLDR
jgi:FAD/FMN-containing dehydrogenase/Fe-S oxidoreductase